MWKPFAGRSSRRRSLPEADEETLRLVLLLRLELLYAAVIYGTCAVLSSQGEDAGVWIDWFDWVRGLVANLREGLDPARYDAELPRWLSEAIEAVENASDDVERHDLFSDEPVRGWAREEFEALGERSRPIEQLGGEPLGGIEDRPSPAGVRLLAVIQDSLVLVSSGPSEQTRGKRANAAEVLQQLIAAREEGVWELLTS